MDTRGKVEIKAVFDFENFILARRDLEEAKFSMRVMNREGRILKNITDEQEKPKLFKLFRSIEFGWNHWNKGYRKMKLTTRSKF